MLSVVRGCLRLRQAILVSCAVRIGCRRGGASSLSTSGREVDIYIGGVCIGIAVGGLPYNCLIYYKKVIA